jgi:hypothetical protein
MGGTESLARAFSEQRIHGVRLGDRIRHDTVVRRSSRGADRKPVLELSHGPTERFGRVVVGGDQRRLRGDPQPGRRPLHERQPDRRGAPRATTTTRNSLKYRR